MVYGHDQKVNPTPRYYISKMGTLSFFLHPFLLNSTPASPLTPSMTEPWPGQELIQIFLDLLQLPPRRPETPPSMDVVTYTKQGSKVTEPNSAAVDTISPLYTIRGENTAEDKPSPFRGTENHLITHVPKGNDPRCMGVVRPCHGANALGLKICLKTVCTAQGHNRKVNPAPGYYISKKGTLLAFLHPFLPNFTLSMPLTPLIIKPWPQQVLGQLFRDFTQAPPQRPVMPPSLPRTQTKGTTDARQELKLLNYTGPDNGYYLGIIKIWHDAADQWPCFCLHLGGPLDGCPAASHQCLKATLDQGMYVRCKNLPSTYLNSYIPPVALQSNEEEEHAQSLLAKLLQ